MGKFGLQFKATLENITNVRPDGDDFRWYLKCVLCRSEWIRHSSAAGVFKHLSVTAGLRIVHQPKMSSQQRPVTTDEGLEDDQHKLYSSRRAIVSDFTSTRWTDKLKCGNCGEVSDKWQYITLLDSMPLKGGRGSASMVQKCKLCSRENSIDILKDTITPYNAEDSERFKTMVQFECRGLEPVDFQPQAGFAAKGAETTTQFLEINLQEKDWTDYDEKASESVGIYEVTHQFIKC